MPMVPLKRSLIPIRHVMAKEKLDMAIPPIIRAILMMAKARKAKATTRVMGNPLIPIPLIIIRIQDIQAITMMTMKEKIMVTRNIPTLKTTAIRAMAILPMGITTIQVMGIMTTRGMDILLTAIMTIKKDMDTLVMAIRAMAIANILLIKDTATKRDHILLNPVPLIPKIVNPPHQAMIRKAISN